MRVSGAERLDEPTSREHGHVAPHDVVEADDGCVHIMINIVRLDRFLPIRGDAATGVMSAVSASQGIFCSEQM
ncbi:hypothetical protein ACMHYB_44760 [Sorangium sp. So ce1128]